MATTSVDVCEEKWSDLPTDVTNSVDVSASELLCGKLNLFYIDLFMSEHNYRELSCLVFHMPS